MIAIIGILVALVLPSVQSARESARNITCQNNLRQQSLAVQNYESAHKEIPSLYFGTFLKQPRTAMDEFHFHSWQTAILPHVEESSLYDRIDLSRAASMESNHPILKTEIATFKCPSANSKNSRLPDVHEYNNGNTPVRTFGPAARSDYEVFAGARIANFSIKFGAWGEPTYSDGINLVKSIRTARFRDIRDGLSKTMLIGEKAGRPDLYEKGKAVDPYPYSYSPPNIAPIEPQQTAWGISTHIMWLVLESFQVNQTNATGIFGFHKSGANAGFADGSVRFLSEDTDVNTLRAMVTRSAGDRVELE